MSLLFLLFIRDEYLPESDHFSSTIESFRKDFQEIFSEFEDNCQRKDPMYVCRMKHSIDIDFALN